MTFGAVGSINASSANITTVGATQINAQSIAIGASGATSPTIGTLSVSGPILSTGGLNVGSTGPNMNNGTLGVSYGVIIGSTGLTGATGSFVATGQGQVGALYVGSIATFGATGTIRASDNITAYYSSDKTLKENIQDIPGALDKVLAIGGKTFDWTDAYIQKHGGLDDYFQPKSDFGVIAQDVQAVFPVAVRIRDDGTLAVDYEKLCALAFAAIKELNDKIEGK